MRAANKGDLGTHKGSSARDGEAEHLFVEDAATSEEVPRDGDSGEEECSYRAIEDVDGIEKGDGGEDLESKE